MEISFFTRQELLNLLRCADLYCHPAEVEIESIACLEAIACGLVPVIADSPKSAAKAFALDDKSLFKNKDAEDMARKIDYWVSHPDERADYSRKYLDSGTQFEQQSCMRQMEQMLLTPQPWPVRRYEPQDRLLSRPAARRLCADQRAHPPEADRRGFPV